MWSLGEPRAGLRTLFRSQNSSDFPLQCDLMRNLVALCLNQLLPQSLDLLIVRAVSQKLGFELAVKGHNRRRSLMRGPVLIDNRFDLLALLVGEVDEPCQPAEPRTTDARPARPTAARPATLRVGYGESRHGNQRRDETVENRLLHVYLPRLNRQAACGALVAEL